MMKYYYFLESVTDVADEFPEISDLVSRYETLQAAHDSLMDRAAIADKQQEEQGSALQDLIRAKTDEILSCNNTIATMQKEQEKSSERALQKQLESERQISDVAERTLQLGQVMMACENIYQRCCDRSSVQRKARSSADADETMIVIDKLLFIQDYLLDLTAITKGREIKGDKHRQGAPVGAGVAFAA